MGATDYGRTFAHISEAVPQYTYIEAYGAERCRLESDAVFSLRIGKG